MANPFQVDMPSFDLTNFNSPTANLPAANLQTQTVPQVETSTVPQSFAETMGYTQSETPYDELSFEDKKLREIDVMKLWEEDPEGMKAKMLGTMDLDALNTDSSGVMARLSGANASTGGVSGAFTDAGGQGASDLLRQYQEGQQSQTQTYQDMIDQGAGYLDPYRQAGASGLNLLQAGIENGQFDPGQFQSDAVAPGQFNYQGQDIGDVNSFMGDFTQTPGYQARLQQGQLGLDRASAAGGRFGGGQTAKELMRFGQDYASNEYGNEYNRAQGRRQDAVSQEQQGYGRAVDQYGRDVDEYGREYGKDLTSYGLESDRLGNQYNQLSGLAGMGQQAATATGGMYSGLGSQLLGNQFQQQMQNQQLNANSDNAFMDNVGGIAGMLLGSFLP